MENGLPIIHRGDLIVQKPYDGDERWYVQSVSLLDYGRFATKEEALKHKEFLEQSTWYFGK